LCTQPRRVLAEKRRERLAKIAGRNALQVKDRQQHFQALRAPRIGRQDRWCELDSSIVGAGVSIAHARLAHLHSADARHHGALGQMAVAHHTLATVLSLQVGVLFKKICCFRLHGFGQKRACSRAQNLGEQVGEIPWLGQRNHISFRHGVSSFDGKWRL